MSYPGIMEMSKINPINGQNRPLQSDRSRQHFIVRYRLVRPAILENRQNVVTNRRNSTTTASGKFSSA
jgi:hypothetical protein